jgi:hypothetical protein
MIRECQRRAGAVRIFSNHGDVFVLPHHSEAEVLERVNHAILWRIDGELPHLYGHVRFGQVGFEDRRLGVKGVGTKRLDVKLDGGRDVGKRLVVAVALTNDDTVYSEWICDVPILMLFDNHFQVRHHGSLRLHSDRSLSIACLEWLFDLPS